MYGVYGVCTVCVYSVCMVCVYMYGVCMARVCSVCAACQLLHNHVGKFSLQSNPHALLRQVPFNRVL